MSTPTRAVSTTARAACVPWQLFRGPAPTPGPAPVIRQEQSRELCRALSASIDALAKPVSTREGQALGLVDERSATGSGMQPREARISGGLEDVQNSLQAVLKSLEVAKEDSAAFHEVQAREVILDLLLADVPARLLTCLDALDFETRKDAMRLFGAVLRLGPHLGADRQVIEYVRTHPRISQLLLEGSGRPEVFSHCAQMLRSCTRYPQLVAYLHDQHAICRLIDLARHQSFDISSEAFSSLRELLLAHKAVSAGYLKDHFNEYFQLLNSLLQVDDYVTRRQALRLLGQVLLDRNFMQVMVSYVGNEQFLQIHMNLLRDSSKAIQLEAFHVFKIFVANPNKPYRVQQILFRNKARLVKLLDALGIKREADRALTQDLKAVIGILQVMGPAVLSDMADDAVCPNEVVMVA